MKVMILSAGRGERMMPLTKDTPKPLIKVHDKTLIEHSIDTLKNAGITDVIINIAYLGEQIQAYLGNGAKFGINIKYSIEQNALETAGGIIQALPLLGNAPFIVINSDILCDYDLSTLALPDNSLAHLLLIDNPEHNLNGDFSLTGNKITLPNTQTYTFSGVGFYHPDFFQSHLHNDGKLPLSALFKEAINNRQLTGEYYLGYWQDIGTPKRLESVNNNPKIS
ncbi:Nucleotidyl transferase possibly involved in threonylcarbamoyladenosine formation [uncultured Gammaproteobacteria bacterium]|jgi:MurNAc alpha-1-phosphate uridylyltransferase|uniref:N-acetylmuramate alpha-1-phosphate uridylyltransferase MurU n=1 Tax=thiotrophic endosymbiont of Bathymodiolus puteoserpentis (Logatchev) TaxID=343240 RepID=UPI0010B45E37|nr:nucleotidyltransferase family protein [thiotrophic endosymbiont of Bathymodiolus puteoserpentis (Logatchev)]CAC9575435.1 Nucleotidyl transferase possibly involved in threonylcarbamoyladenosine formation [uncultured Gammaproteobacteria bacterium]CAC9955650.1 Nucleotidyl transferase possibly involved in threonylcarbamoyladenosine formation [uncultured Gammaproteobacteria bacterium]CAC9980376.1 Nucleotidyl transferase possibly involved in threonylcarbamoyladenosine formation [uncultured Gammapro